jgi:hypothetical protein
MNRWVNYEKQQDFTVFYHNEHTVCQKTKFKEKCVKCPASN